MYALGTSKITLNHEFYVMFGIETLNIVKTLHMCIEHFVDVKLAKTVSSQC